MASRMTPSISSSSKTTFNSQSEKIARLELQIRQLNYENGQLKHQLQTKLEEDERVSQLNSKLADRERLLLQLQTSKDIAMSKAAISMKNYGEACRRAAAAATWKKMVVGLQARIAQLEGLKGKHEESMRFSARDSETAEPKLKNVQEDERKFCIESRICAEDTRYQPKANPVEHSVTAMRSVCRSWSYDSAEGRSS